MHCVWIAPLTLPRSTLLSPFTQLCVISPPPPHQSQFLLPQYSWVCALALESGLLFRAYIQCWRKLTLPLLVAVNCH